MGKRIPFDEYKKSHPKLVVLQHQPKFVEVVETKTQLKKWYKDLVLKVGIPLPNGVVDDDDMGAPEHGHTSTYYTQDGKDQYDTDCET
jgi:hypothetical protein